MKTHIYLLDMTTGLHFDPATEEFSSSKPINIYTDEWETSCHYRDHMNKLSYEPNIIQYLASESIDEALQKKKAYILMNYLMSKYSAHYQSLYSFFEYYRVEKLKWYVVNVRRSDRRAVLNIGINCDLIKLSGCDEYALVFEELSGEDMLLLKIKYDKIYDAAALIVEPVQLIKKVAGWTSAYWYPAIG